MHIKLFEFGLNYELLKSAGYSPADDLGFRMRPNLSRQLHTRRTYIGGISLNIELAKA